MGHIFYDSSVPPELCEQYKDKLMAIAAGTPATGTRLEKLKNYKLPSDLCIFQSALNDNELTILFDFFDKLFECGCQNITFIIC